MLLRTFLDRLYAAAGVIAALCLIAILVVIVLQMGARWLLIPFPGSSEYAGYLMAASSFLAFAYVLNSGAHIRVSLFLSALGHHRFWAELWCMVIGTAAAICRSASAQLQAVRTSDSSCRMVFIARLRHLR